MYSILDSSLSRFAIERLRRSGEALALAQRRASSGRRVDSARGDPAGSAIAARFEAQTRGYRQAVRNAADHAALLRVGEGALGSVADNLQRIRELALAALNPTLDDDDCSALQAEVGQLVLASDAIQDGLEFNGRRPLDGRLIGETLLSGLPGEAGIVVNLAPLFARTRTDASSFYVQYAQASVAVPVSGALSAGDLTLNGKPVGASTAGALPGQSAGSAWAVARAIEQAGIAGLSVGIVDAALTGSDLPAGPLAGVPAGAITLNGVPLPANPWVSQINALAAQTGVGAQERLTVDGQGNAVKRLVLTASGGRDIELGGDPSLLGLAGGLTRGRVLLLTEPGPGATADLIVGGANPEAAGFAAGTVGAQPTGEPVLLPLDESTGVDLHFDVRSRERANAVIAAVDAKLERLGKQRANLGAALNRLETMGSGFERAAENAAAAHSRIADADYAEVVATLAREKILTEAASAMLVQANAWPRRVLALLAALRRD